MSIINNTRTALIVDAYLPQRLSNANTVITPQSPPLQSTFSIIPSKSLLCYDTADGISNLMQNCSFF